MKKTRVKKVNKTRLLILGVPSLIIIGVFIFNLLLYIYNIGNANISKNKKEEYLKELKRQEKILTTEIEKLQDPNYIAKYARENYSYSKDGEYIIKINNEEEKKEDEKFELNIDYNYFIYGSGILLFIIFIFLLKKK